MNKGELIDALESRLGGKKAASAAVEGLLDVIIREVAKGKKVGITGFGTFERVARAARIGRNPRTGASVKIKKTAVPKFKAGTKFRAVVSDPKQLPKTTAAGARASAGTSAASKATAKKTAVKKIAPAKKTAVKKAAPAKKTAVKRTSVKKAAAILSSARKSAPARSTPSKATVKKAAATLGSAKKSTPARKTAGRKTAAKKA